MMGGIFSIFLNQKKPNTTEEMWKEVDVRIQLSSIKSYICFAKIQNSATPRMVFIKKKKTEQKISVDEDAKELEPLCFAKGV